MNVRIIPEDDENDHFILKPIFEAMFKHLGKPQARCEDPLAPRSAVGKP